MKWKLWLLASVMTIGATGAAQAQQASTTAAADNSTTVKEVVVTAERRTTNLQKTADRRHGADRQPTCMKKGVFTVDQLQFVSPVADGQQLRPGQRLRHPRHRQGRAQHARPRTGVVTYRDGVATFPGYFQEEPYYDIANVEVLRGPQGTFSGQNATGGAVIVNTSNPVIDGGYTATSWATTATTTTSALQGAVNLPISDTLAARVAFNTEYRNSFYNITGPWTGRSQPEVGQRALLAAVEADAQR